jgi:hypothetical protein
MAGVSLEISAISISIQHSVVRGLRLWSAAVVGGGKALNRKDREEHRKECKENLESSVRTERTR